MAWSSPIVWKDKIFLTTVISEEDTEEPTKGLYFGGERKAVGSSHEWRTMCLDFETARILWEKTAHQGLPYQPKHVKNTYASETPTTDGERVYVYLGQIGVFAYDMEGHLQWTHPITPVRMRAHWGTASSPVLWQDKLFLVNDNEEQSYLLALDKATGRVLWKVDREEKSNWSTPFVWHGENRTEIVIPGTGRNRSYDLEGNLLWELTGSSAITVPTPLSAHGLLYLSSGYVADKRRPIFAIKPGAQGDISLTPKQTSHPFIAWVQPQAAPYNPSILVYGDYLYVLLDRGYIACYDAKTGEVIYDIQKLSGSKEFTASPWAYNGMIFCLSEEGKTHVLRAGPVFETLHTNSLEEMCMACPAMAHGSLLIRTEKRLYRLQSR